VLIRGQNHHSKALHDHISDHKPFNMNELARRNRALLWRGETAPCFGAAKPRPAQTAPCSLAAERVGIDKQVSPHTFRRSCTTELIRSGANMYHVKELLGHESLATLKHYAKLTILDLKKTHAKCHPREREDRR